MTFLPVLAQRLSDRVGVTVLGKMHDIAQSSTEALRGTLCLMTSHRVEKDNEDVRFNLAQEVFLQLDCPVPVAPSDCVQHVTPHHSCCELPRSSPGCGRSTSFIILQYTTHG